VSDFLHFSLRSGFVDEASFTDSVGGSHHSSGGRVPMGRHNYRDAGGCQRPNGGRLGPGVPDGARDGSVPTCSQCRQLLLCRRVMVCV
jgi:hypothetical protein